MGGTVHNSDWQIVLPLSPIPDQLCTNIEKRIRLRPHTVIASHPSVISFESSQAIWVRLSARLDDGRSAIVNTFLPVTPELPSKGGTENHSLVEHQ
jgi:hypothetical protein